MFEVTLKVTLTNPNPIGGCLKDHLKFFKSKIDELNSSESNHNQKTVTIINTDMDDAIIVKVTSELELGVPGRAFTGLSRSLLDEKSTDFDPFFKNNLFHGRLLSFEKLYADEEDSLKVSDTDLIVRVTILATKPKSHLTNAEQDILKQLKILAAQLPNTMEGE